MKVKLEDFEKYRRGLMSILLKKYEYTLCEDAIQETFFDYKKLIESSKIRELKKSKNSLFNWLCTVSSRNCFKLYYRAKNKERSIVNKQEYFEDIKIIEDEDGYSTSKYDKFNIVDGFLTVLDLELETYINNRNTKNFDVLKCYLAGMSDEKVQETMNIKRKSVTGYRIRAKNEIKKVFDITGYNKIYRTY